MQAGLILDVCTKCIHSSLRTNTSHTPYITKKKHVKCLMKTFPIPERYLNLLATNSLQDIAMDTRTNKIQGHEISKIFGTHL